MDKKYYHRGNGEVVLPGSHKFFNESIPQQKAEIIASIPIYAYCDPDPKINPVGWIEGEEVWQIFIDEKWVTCHKSLYDRYTKDKRIWIEPKRGQPHKCQYCGAMTTEEYLEEWWTSKEFPENGFNKTAMLDFAEWYAGQKVFRQPLVKTSMR